MAIVVPHMAVATSVAIGADLLWRASVIAHEEDGAPLARIVFVSQLGGDVPCGGGLGVARTLRLGEVGQVDAVWVAAFWAPVVEAMSRDADLPNWLRRQHAWGAAVATHGSAAFFAAEARLLDGGQATTHPCYVEELSRRYPEVSVRPERTLTVSRRVSCSAGANSAFDAVMLLCEELYGASVARRVQRATMVDSRRGYDVAPSVFDGQKDHRDTQVLEVQRWIEQHFVDPGSIADIAQRFAMSPRTLARRFSAATGDTPSHYLQRVRVEAAKDLLRRSAMSVGEVAVRVGYSDLGAFHAVFLRATETTPAAFRRVPA